LTEYTNIKEKILENYLHIWFTVLSSRYSLLYVDGFAGTGKTVDDKPGSPLLALEQAAWAWEKHQDTVFGLVFIEKNKKNHQMLMKNVSEKFNELENKSSNPNGFKERFLIDVEHDDFHEAITDLKKILCKSYVASLIFIDPFNCQIPMESINKLLNFPKTEIILNFMVSGIVRNKCKYRDDKLKMLFGRKPRINIRLRSTTHKDIIKEYVESLKEFTGAYALTYEMRNKKNTLLYYLVYATKSGFGVGKMKDVMSKLSADPLYFTNDKRRKKPKIEQIKLFDLETPPIEVFKKDLIENFKTQPKFTFEELREHYVYTDEYSYREAHIKDFLKQLEDEKVIFVFSTKTNGETRRKRTFPDGTQMKILSQN